MYPATLGMSPVTGFIGCPCKWACCLPVGRIFSSRQNQSFKAPFHHSIRFTEHKGVRVEERISLLFFGKHVTEKLDYLYAVFKDPHRRCCPWTNDHSSCFMNSNSPRPLALSLIKHSTVDYNSGRTLFSVYIQQREDVMFLFSVAIKDSLHELHHGLPEQGTSAAEGKEDVP